MKTTILITLTLFALIPSVSIAAPCTTYQLTSYAKTIANRERAAAQVAIATQAVQLELENQARIVAAMEQQFQITLNAQAAIPDYLKLKVIESLQSSFKAARTKQSKTGNEQMASANRALRSAQLNYESASKSASRPLTCQIGGSTSPIPSSINLEAQNIRTGIIAKNGSTLLSVPGDSIFYRWSATNSTGGTSVYRITSGPNICGWATTGPWELITSGSGQILATVQTCQKGSSYEITYRPTNANGALLGEQKIAVVVQ